MNLKPMLKLYSWKSTGDHERKYFFNKFEKFWFILICSSLIFASFILYSGASSVNDLDNINLFIWSQIYKTRWINWFLLLFILIFFSILYVCGITLSAFIHFFYEIPLKLALFNKIVFWILFFVYVGYCIVLSKVYPQNFILVQLSFQLLLPIFQIIFMTILLISFYGILKLPLLKDNKILVNFIKNNYAVLFVYFLILPFIYTNPCVQSNLPTKPLLVGHRGCPSLAPENTILSFEKAANCGVSIFETDVHISLDGVPFLLHDGYLLRTTNVREIFPSLLYERADNLNWTQLQMLNAGNWFLKNNPFLLNHLLTKDQKNKIRSQKILSFEEYVYFAKKTNKGILFDIKLPPYGHRWRYKMVNVLVEIIRKVGLNESQVYWLTSNVNSLKHLGDPKFNFVSHRLITEPNSGYKAVNLGYNVLVEDLRKQSHLPVINYVLDRSWLFSIGWCQSVWATTTNFPCKFQHIKRPVFHLSPSAFYGLWIFIDIVFIFCAIFIIYLCPHHFPLLKNKFMAWSKAEDHNSLQQV